MKLSKVTIAFPQELFQALLVNGLRTLSLMLLAPMASSKTMSARDLADSKFRSLCVNWGESPSRIPASVITEMIAVSFYFMLSCYHSLLFRNFDFLFFRLVSIPNWPGKI